MSNTLIKNVTGSINSFSFFNETDTNLFYVSQSNNVCYGRSENDVIELSVYDTNDNSLLNWNTIHSNKKYNSVTSSYLNYLNVTKQYSYNEFVSDFIQHNTDSILVNPIEDLNTVGITDGNFNVTYNFVREMAGTINTPLSIKEISPSRTEIKLIPSVNTLKYTAFCSKQFVIKDVAINFILQTQDCQYSNIYNQISKSYSDSISFLKTIFFLTDDTSVLLFLKNLFEDYIKYTSLSNDQITNGIEPTRIFRIEGIRSYFKNYIYENYENISNFDVIENKFSEIVNGRLDLAFKSYIKQTGKDYKNARQFVYDFFFKYFYQPQLSGFKKVYQSQYYGYLKNVLNFGNNQYYSILSSAYIDERQNPDEPLTLILKLSKELPYDFSEKSNCWVSNFSLVPYSFIVRLQNPTKYKTTKISAANFGIQNKFITAENVNKMYSSDDLTLDSDVENSIYVNKKASELNIDYSNFENFVIFSSISSRINVFKNKIVNWTVLSGSLSKLNTLYTNSLTSSILYPYYKTENDTITSNMTELVQSFDGYESYLFNSGKYNYSTDSGSFVDSDYVSSQDSLANYYDKKNRDSLLSNTPEYILKDSNNEEYLTFLTMIGHHFDNIYTYISSMPIEKHTKNQLSSSISTNTLKEVLYSFGWNVDDIIGHLDLDEVYLNSLTNNSYNILSAEQRLQTIWNRILVTLPGIYKTKGTEECVKYLMSCYGLPSSLISIREYGGSDYSNNVEPTYKLDEKTYMLVFSGTNDFVQGPMPSSVHTVEFKFTVESGSYSNYDHNTLFASIPYGNNNISASSWKLEIEKMPGTSMGRINFNISGSSTLIHSDILPIFNGEIFSVMLRKNQPDVNFEVSSNSLAYPLQYDLTVQRNEDGRQIFYSTSSAIYTINDNTTFDNYGKFQLSDGNFKGTIDKLSIWNVSIDDYDFEEHVNDINSYGYSGSNSYTNLMVRLSVDYPRSMYYNLSGSSSVWVDNMSSYYALPNYYTNTLNLSSSINLTLYSASLDITKNKWSANLPSGSATIIAYNFPSIVNPNWSASFDGCNTISSSAYPYHYRELIYQQDIDASKYGPSKYKNKKIRKVNYVTEARFDTDNKSTNLEESTVSGESNQLGFFIDPQDSKNKDIIRYVGNTGIMPFIADPSNVYEGKYTDLITKNYEYHAVGNKKTYFNEMITMYKFYFDKSIFQTIKNILPARANIFTGIVIEPTILERPKYQNRPITSSYQTYNSKIKKSYKFSENLLWTNFNTDWSQINSPVSCSNGVALQKAMQNSLPASYQDTIDLTRLNKPIKIRPANINLGYVTDEMDSIQRCVYGDYENLTRGWELTPQCNNWIYGSVSRNKTSDLASIDYHHFPFGYDETQFVPNKKHQILYYMLKVWEKYHYYAKTGEYVRSNNPSDDKYSKATVYLYNYIMVDERFMNDNVHFYDGFLTTVPNDPSSEMSSGKYLHHSNTFKNTPNQSFSNVKVSFTTSDPISYPTQFNLTLSNENRYFELVKGYPRNHASHKNIQFSKQKYSNYVKGRNTINNTINENGIDDGSIPVQTFAVSNVSVKSNSNVIQSVVSSNGGKLQANNNISTLNS